ncbi:hypothetical protein TNCV_1513771 [Trichonephila clavipes]|nr:hypothetical protein TNCV_1513771 [Trichonephila clavipes]
MPLTTCYVEDLMHVKSLVAQCSLWLGIEVWRVGFQHKCRPCLLTIVQNYEICHHHNSNVASEYDENYKLTTTLNCGQITK